MTVDIIGAGIAGLTAAIALEKKGFEVRIFEQAKELLPIGAGIILANNAMQVYDRLGLRNEIEENGNHISKINLTNPNLNPISTVDLAYFEKKYGVKNTAIHRGNLQQILLNQLTSTQIFFNHELSSIHSNENGHRLLFTNGIEFQSSVLIGADGIHSKIRQHLFPKIKIRNAKQTCWRGITTYTLPIQYQHELNEAWGNKNRFGFVQLTENKVYWYALKTNQTLNNEQSKTQILEQFSPYNKIIQEIISSTNEIAIHSAEIFDLKPFSKWHQTNVCLIGDAAHATTPNLGQGACQAIEDAYQLAECLGKFEPNIAFEKFNQLRLKKAHLVVKSSWILGKIAHLSNPIAITFRNFMMKITPSFMNRKNSEFIFKLEEHK